jgi:hypothetical protein
MLFLTRYNVHSVCDIMCIIDKLFTKRTFAIIRHLTPDAIQKEVKVGQLTSFKDSVNLSFFYNEHTGYNPPTFRDQTIVASVPDYIYLGAIHPPISWFLF